MAHKLIQRNFMIIWIIILLSIALVLMLFFTGCEKNTDVIKASEIPNETQKTGASETASPAEVTNETKNEASGTASPDLSSNKDILLKSILSSSLYPEQNEDFEITVSVENAGTEEIASFGYIIKITKEGVLVKSDSGVNSEPLIVGGKTKIRKEYSFSEKGKYSIEVKLDYENKIREKNELNNIKTFEVTVVAPPAVSDSTENEVPAPKPSGTCSDTDGGKIYTKKGKCTDQVAYIAGFNDFCTSDGELIEMYCKEGECVQDAHNCLCSEGACSS